MLGLEMFGMTGNSNWWVEMGGRLWIPKHRGRARDWLFKYPLAYQYSDLLPCYSLLVKYEKLSDGDEQRYNTK
jgi:hypothetical protein